MSQSNKYLVCSSSLMNDCYCTTKMFMLVIIIETVLVLNMTKRIFITSKTLNVL